MTNNKLMDSKIICLSGQERQQVIKAFRKESFENGHFDFGVTLSTRNGNVTICLDGYFYSAGYTEDDHHCGYGNGTGAYIETCRDVDVRDVTAVLSVYGDDIDVECLVDDASCEYIANELRRQ